MKARSVLVLAGLLALTAVPVIAGAARVAQLTGGATVTPENARFFAQPVPVIVHIFSASTYCIVGAFQFSSALRRRWPVWHRWAGRFLAPSGITAALAGLWMTIFYPRPPADHLLLEAFRIVFGSAMIAAHRPGLPRHKAGGRSRAPRVDDAWLRDRAGRWHASAHQLALDVVGG